MYFASTYSAASQTSLIQLSDKLHPAVRYNFRHGISTGQLSQLLTVTMKNLLIAALALVGTSMVGASPVDMETSLAPASPFEVDKRARLGYAFYVRSGQLKKCVVNGPRKARS